MACTYKLIMEYTTFAVPGLVIDSEDCEQPVDCCENDGDNQNIDCDGNALDECSADWATAGADFENTPPILRFERKTVILPPGSSVLQTQCKTLTCTFDPDQQCIPCES